MKTTTTFWQRIGNHEVEVACDYYYDGVHYTGQNSGCYYTGNIRPAR